MFRFSVPAFAVALALPAAPCAAQVSTPTTPRVGVPTSEPVAGPPAPARLPGQPPLLVPRDGPLPPTLTIADALAEAEERSPAIVAARARIEAAEARLGQAGVRTNPELSVEVENVLGTGDLAGLRGAELTVSVSQRLDLFGRRRARVGAAQAAAAVERLRLAVARADLAQAVRETFAQAATQIQWPLGRIGAGANRGECPAARPKFLASSPPQARWRRRATYPRLHRQDLSGRHRAVTRHRW